MLLYHIKTAWRNLLRNKLQTGINVVGLAIGVAGCLSIFLLSNYELNFNKKIVDAERIYRVYTQFNGQFSGVNSGVPTGIATLAESSLEGTDVQCILHSYRATVTVPGESGSTSMKKLKDQEDIVITGPQYFDLIYNYEWIAGSPRQSLGAPAQVVLTEAKARKYFGLKDVREALGREIIYADSLLVTVSGLIKEPDFYSDFYFTDFISLKTIPGSPLKNEIPIEEWGGIRSSDQFFVKASEGVTKDALAALLKPLNDRSNAGSENSKNSREFKLQPLLDLHYNQELGLFDFGRSPAHLPTLYGLMFVAVLLLIIASINFINLATVQATRRAKETGVRKVIGATKSQLTKQFLIETALLTGFALPLAMAFSEFAFRYFSEFLPVGLTVDLFSPALLGFLIGIVIVVTLLAGFYPAFVMSSVQIAGSLKNQSANFIGKRSSGLRKGLIVFQFVLAQAFIIGAIIIGKQMSFVLHKDLGFNKEAVIYFNTYGLEHSKKQVFQRRLEQIPIVKSTSIHNKPPIDLGYQTSIINFEQNGEPLKSEVHFRMVDTAYLGLYDIELLAGRNLLPSDTVKEFLINETLAKRMGFSSSEASIGKTVDFQDKLVPIAGVVKDFHVKSFHYSVPPTVLTCTKSGAYCLAAKISNEQPFSSSLEKFKTVWQEILPNKDFQYTVLNETVEKLYQSEIQIAKLINTATGLAILISCLGLFGLTFFTVTQRSKEISIRKVLGASVTNIVGLLSKDFMRLVLIALVIASPLAYYFMEKWLQDFAYRINFQWWVFVLTGIVAISIAFITVGIQSLKAALTNPSKSLHSE